ncbi:MAG TPA: CTP synthase, partial [Anseongella sp.]
KKGGTMRLGAYPCDIKKGTKAWAAYGKARISERHRHRYEFNNKYLKQYNDGGMISSGINPNSGLVELVELKDHPWFVGCQFHPELKSTVANPHPLFVKFVEAAKIHKAEHRPRKL